MIGTNNLTQEANGDAITVNKFVLLTSVKRSYNPLIIQSMM